MRVELTTHATRSGTDVPGDVAVAADVVGEDEAVTAGVGQHVLADGGVVQRTQAARAGAHAHCQAVVTQVLHRATVTTHTHG